MANLNSSEKDAIIDLYESRLRTHGVSHKTVGWGDDEGQRLRFSELFRGVDPTGMRILDVGCGLGDLVPFLDSMTGGDYEYIGIDIAPALIQTASNLHDGRHRTFESTNFLEWENNQIFDIAVLSGALSFRVEDNETLAKSVLRRMFHQTKYCVAANFLTSYVDFKLDKNFHYQPEELFSFARSLSGRTCLNHDYPLWEFTLQIFHTEEPSQ